MTIRTHVENPSIRQTTAAFELVHASSHTVPHCPPKFTSTLPSILEPPLASRTVTFCIVPAPSKQLSFRNNVQNNTDIKSVENQANFHYSVICCFTNDNEITKLKSADLSYIHITLLVSFFQ